jgi:hypothetical protein
MSAAYDFDFYAWADEQAALARSRSANRLDWDNVAEELDGLARQQEWELYNRYVVLLTHLLKWMFQPVYRGPSWEVTIRNQRRDIARQLKKAPSLQSADAEEFAEAYKSARGEAMKQTGLALDTFPAQPPFTSEQARDPEFWPEAAQNGRNLQAER